jgi:CDP-glucose 4,6-dehydratase
MLVERLARDPASHATAWNFGPTDHDAKPVSWIADCLADRWGEGAAWSLDSRAHSPELATLRLDASKANAVLGWRPVLSLSEALDWIVDWYREWARGTDIRALTLGQIASYEQLLTSDCSGAAV